MCDENVVYLINRRWGMYITYNTTLQIECNVDMKNVI